MRLGPAIATAVLLLQLEVPAHADDDTKQQSYRAVIDRVDLEPASITGTRLRVYLSALTIGGQLLDLTDPKSIRLMLNGSEKKAPYSLGTYAATAADTVIVFVVEGSQAYADVLPTVIESVDGTLLGGLKEPGTQVAVLPYGDVTGVGKLAPLKTGRAKLTGIANDGSVGDPALLDTVEKALSILKRAKTEPEGRALRKMIVVIGDGRDRSADRERVTRLGKRAAKEGVRIHALAFSPLDVRRPLLLLGELAKQSFGTFRWVRSAKLDSWNGAVQQLRDEITQENVVTYYLDTGDDVAGKKLKIITVGRTEATSNEVKIPAATCGGQVCEVGYCAADLCVVPAAPTGRGIVGWIILVGGIGLGAILTLGVIGWLLSKRQVPAPVVAGVAGLPAPGVPPVARPAKVKPRKAAPAPPIAAAVVAPIVGGPVLFVLSGPRAGEKIPLTHGFTIGKAPGSNLVIDDGFTSSQHAQIGMDQFGNCRLYDRGSTNGTTCNGVRVTEYVLQHGVVIQIGNTQLRFLAQ